MQFAEFIYEQPAVGDVEYTFKHALTREVAYRTVLIERRKLLHERAGRAIETLYADSLDNHLAALGDHFREAGNTSAAVNYLRRAGIFAARRSAFPEAVRDLSAALELVKAMPESVERARMESDLLAVLSGCWNATLGAGSAALGETLMRMRDLCVQLSDDEGLFLVECSRLFFHGAREELVEARELGERAIAIAELLQRPSLLAEAYVLHGYILWQLGAFNASRQQLERAIALPARAHSGLAPLHFKMIAEAYLAWNLWVLGFPDQALKEIESSLALMRNESSPSSLAFALIYSAQFHRFLRDPQKSAMLSREAREIANREGFPLLEAQAAYEYGWSRIFGNEIESGLSDMNRAIEALKTTGAVASAWRGGPLAEAWAKSGNAAKGLELLRSALDAVNKTAERFYETELRRLIGGLTLYVDSAKVAEARQAFGEAIDVARSQHARSLELRATISLARLLAKHDQREEARTRLSSIYCWFTEGFETPDLKEAKSLLDELGAQ